MWEEAIPATKQFRTEVIVWWVNRNALLFLSWSMFRQLESDCYQWLPQNCSLRSPSQNLAIEWNVHNLFIPPSTVRFGAAHDNAAFSQTLILINANMRNSYHRNLFPLVHTLDIASSRHIVARMPAIWRLPSVGDVRCLMHTHLKSCRKWIGSTGKSGSIDISAFSRVIPDRLRICNVW